MIRASLSSRRATGRVIRAPSSSASPPTAAVSLLARLDRAAVHVAGVQDSVSYQDSENLRIALVDSVLLPHDRVPGWRAGIFLRDPRTNSR